MWGVKRNKLNLRKFVCLIVMGLVIFLFQGPVLVNASEKEAKIVRVGYYENEIFQEGASEDAVKSGYAYEYYMKLSEYTGWKYEYVYGSYGELYQKLLDGEIDFLAGLAHREERDGLISYPEIEMGTGPYNIIKRRANEDITLDLTSFSGKKIGVLDSAVSDSLEIYLTENNVDAQIVLYDDFTELIDAFDANEVDLLASEGDGTYGRKDTEVLLTFDQVPYYLCVSKDRPDLLAELNKAQEELFIDEPYFRSSLRDKYYASSATAQALSADEREWIENHDSLTVGYLDNYLPYSDTDADGNVAGVVKELIPKIFDIVGVEEIKVDYVGYDTYEDMMAAINTGEVDAVFPVGGGLYYAEQDGIYHTYPLISVSTNLIYKTVVVNPNTATFAINSKNRMQYYYVKTFYPDAEIVYFDGTERCLRAVLNGEADCTTLNGLRANQILKNSDYDKLSLRQLSYMDSRCIGVRIGNEGLLRIFNRGIQIMRDDFAENLAYKYTEGLYTYSVKDWINENLIIILLTVIVVFFVAIHIQVIKNSKLRTRVAALKNINENQEDFIDNMASSLKKLSIPKSGVKASVYEIADLCLLEKNELELKEDKVNIIELTRTIEKQMQDKADKKNISLTFKNKDIMNKDLIVDKARVTQIIESILDNAIMYTKDGGHVTCLLEEMRCNNPGLAGMVFTITDNGYGMSHDFQKIVFEPYTKELLPDNSNADTVGLGLTIASQLVNIMGGKIKIKSKPGEGSEVKVRIDCTINY